MCPPPVPVSHPVLSLEHEATNPAVGDVVKFLCEAERGSLPIVYSFYLDGKILGEPLTPPGRAASLVLSVKEEWSAKNYSCEAKNNVSSERSEPKKFPSVGSHVLSALTNRNMLITWLPVSLLGGMIVAAVFLIYFFRAHKKDGMYNRQKVDGDKCRHPGLGVSPSINRPEEFTTENQDTPIYAMVNKNRAT